MGKQKRRKNKRERGNNETIAWPSQIFKDESIQVSSHLLRNMDRSKKETGATKPRNLNNITRNLNMAVTAKTRRSQSFFQTAIKIPPEDIRNAILNQGETYWATAVRTSCFLMGTTLLQFFNYFLVFGLTGHFRTMLALLPTRSTVIVWFVLMFLADLVAALIIRIGRRLTERYNFPRKYDMYLILLATMIIFATFISSLLYPIFTTPFLLVSTHGVSKKAMNDTECLRARDRFLQEGDALGSVAKLKDICFHHILCITNCRDFRALYFWIFGTYFMTVVRFLVIITIWNVVSFLCMVMNVKEQHYEMVGLPDLSVTSIV